MWKRSQVKLSHSDLWLPLALFTPTPDSSILTSTVPLLFSVSIISSAERSSFTPPHPQPHPSSVLFPSMYFGFCRNFHHCAINHIGRAASASNIISLFWQQSSKIKKNQGKNSKCHTLKAHKCFTDGKLIDHHLKVEAEPKKPVTSHRMDARAVKVSKRLWKQGGGGQRAALPLVQFCKPFAIVDVWNKRNSYESCWHWGNVAQRELANRSWACECERVSACVYFSVFVFFCDFRPSVMWWN